MGNEKDKYFWQLDETGKEIHSRKTKPKPYEPPRDSLADFAAAYEQDMAAKSANKKGGT